MSTTAKTQKQARIQAKARTLTHIIDAQDHSAMAFVACAAVMPQIDVGITQRVVVRCGDTSWARRVCEYAGVQPNVLVSKHCIYATKQLSLEQPEGTNLTAVWTSRESSTAGAGMYQSDLTFNINLASGHIEIPDWFLSAEKFKPYEDLVERLALPALPQLKLAGMTGHDAVAYRNQERAQMRAQLGVSHDESMVVPLADPPETVDAHWYAELTAMLEVAGHRVVLIMPRRALHIDRALRHSREGYLRRILLTDDPLVSFLACADIAISQGQVSKGEYLQDLLIGCGTQSGCGIVLPSRYPETTNQDVLDLKYGMVRAVDQKAAGAAHAAAGLIRRIEASRTPESGTTLNEGQWHATRQAILQEMRTTSASSESDFTRHCTLTLAALFDVVEAVDFFKLSD